MGQQYARHLAPRFRSARWGVVFVFAQKRFRIMSAEPQRTCPSCGNEFSGAMEFCPVCLLRKGLAGGTESGGSSFENAVKPKPDQTGWRFEHYELVTGEDGKPLELGRGAPRGRVSLWKISSSFSCRRGYIYRLSRATQCQRREFVTNAPSPCVVHAIDPCSSIPH